MHIVTLEMKDHYTIMDGLELDHNLNMDDYSRQCNGLLYDILTYDVRRDTGLRVLVVIIEFLTVKIKQ